MKSKEECFICFEEDGILLSPGCLCKNMKVHEPCLEKLRTINRQNVCAVCKHSFRMNPLYNHRPSQHLPHHNYFQIRFECGEVELLHKIVPFIFLLTMYTILLMVSFKDNQYYLYFMFTWAVICILYSSCIMCDCRIPMM